MNRFAIIFFCIFSFIFVACQNVSGLSDLHPRPGDGGGNQGGSGGSTSSSTAGSGGTGGGTGGSGGATSTGGTGGTGGGTGGQGGTGGGNPCPDITFEDAHLILDPVIEGSQTCADIFGSGVCGFNMTISRLNFINGVLGQIQTDGFSNPLNPTFTDEAVNSSAQRAVWARVYPPPLAGAFNGGNATTSCFANDVAALVDALSHAYMVPDSFAGDQSLPIAPGHVTAATYKVWGASASEPLNFNNLKITVTNNTGNPADFSSPMFVAGIDVRLRCLNSLGTTTQEIVALDANGIAEFTTLNCYSASGSFDLQIQFEITNGAVSSNTFKLGFHSGNDFDVRRGVPGTQEDEAALITVQ